MSRDRDHILEQALKHELRAAGTPADAHLDAETLAAWVDDGLDAAAATACEAHVSNCSRCQALVATLARGTASAPSTLGTQGTPGTFSLWKWWLAPIAAGVTAVTLWMVIPEDQQRLAEAPPQARESRAADSFSQPAPAIVESQKPAAESRIEVDQLAAAARDDRQQQNQAVSERKEEEAAKLELRDRAASADAALVPAAPPPPAAVALEPSAGAAPAMVGALQKRAGADVALFEVPTLRPGVRWRVIGDFFLELTENNGASWQRKHQIPGVRAGSSPSASVLWLAGGNGSVWLTTDGGSTFTNIGLAEPLDIASVSATDARTASVFTVSGRRFRTSDAGRTWQPF